MFSTKDPYDKYGSLADVNTNFDTSSDVSSDPHRLVIDFSLPGSQNGDLNTNENSQIVPVTDVMQSPQPATSAILPIEDADAVLDSNINLDVIHTSGTVTQAIHNIFHDHYMRFAWLCERW